jgi:hypothetical protein
MCPWRSTRPLALATCRPDPQGACESAIEDGQLNRRVMRRELLTVEEVLEAPEPESVLWRRSGAAVPPGRFELPPCLCSAEAARYENAAD